MNEDKIEIKSNYENFITSTTIYSAIFKRKSIPTITKSSTNKANYGLPKQTKSKEDKGEK